MWDRILVTGVDSGRILRFFRTRIWALSQKLWEKPDPDPESLFNFGRSRGLCNNLLSKNMGKLRLD